MNTFYYRRLAWYHFSSAFPYIVVVYLIFWSIIISGGFLPQEVCDTAASPNFVSNLATPTLSESAATDLLAHSQLQLYRDNLMFQHEYALRSPRAEHHNLAPLLKEAIVQLDALIPSIRDWRLKLSEVMTDLHIRHIVFRAHFAACLDFPKQRPWHFVTRVLIPFPEALSILRGFFGSSLFIPFYAHPKIGQVYNHLKTQYHLFREPFSKDVKALLSHPGSVQYEASASAIAAALQEVRAHTTGKKNTFQLLHQDIAANPSQAERTLDSLGWRWSVKDPHRLSRQPDTLNELEHTLTNAGAYTSHMIHFIVRSERELLELDANFDRLTAEDVFQGRGASALQRFDTQLPALLLLPEKAGTTGTGWLSIKERAERKLGIWKEGEDGKEKSSKGVLDNDGAEAEEVTNERELWMAEEESVNQRFNIWFPRIYRYMFKKA